jgi:hypothetical protein
MGAHPHGGRRSPVWALWLGEKAATVLHARTGQNRVMAGRKRLLTPDLASALAEKVAAGETWRQQAPRLVSPQGHCAGGGQKVSRSLAG